MSVCALLVASNITGQREHLSTGGRVIIGTVHELDPFRPIFKWSKFVDVPAGRVTVTVDENWLPSSGEAVTE